MATRSLTITISVTKPNPVLSPVLNELGGSIAHGYFTRQGGASNGIYNGLNVGLGSDDDRERVLQNRGLVAAHFDLSPERLATAYQVHSNDVAILTSDSLKDERPKLDGFATNEPDIAIGILTADCGPVLFGDANAGVIGGCHAGWKGATGNIMEKTINKMVSLGASRQNIKGVLGPTISKKNYEVGPEFVELVNRMANENNQYFVPSEKPGHAYFDLPAYIVDQMDRSNIEATWTGHCTYEDEDLFFSYRRTTHRSEPDYGRQISVITLKA